MSRGYRDIAFTHDVLKAQGDYGSRRVQERLLHRDASTGAADAAGRSASESAANQTHDELSDEERDFISERDGFYLATVSESGWPYVQFRGGPPGFVNSPDAHTIAWEDFRGNRQYISTGNLDHDERVALIFMDYAHQLRLKVFGRAEVVDVRGPSGQTRTPSAVPGYAALVERHVRIDVSAYDWNCPQHITPRFSAAELAPLMERWQRRVHDLELAGGSGPSTEKAGDG